MQDPTNVTIVARVIQMAIAPVFLLTGIGSLLGVLSGRLSRVVDRYRVLESLLGSDEKANAKLNTEMSMLLRRARFVHWAVMLCTVSALFICMVIAFMFIASEIGIDPSRAVSSMFIGAMCSLILGLLCLLREVTLATGSISNPRK